MKPFTPRPYQELIRDHILTTPRCAIWAGMGMGKTSGTLAAIDALQLAEPDPVLVLAPKRVAESTWGDETQKWDQFAGYTVSPIVGTEPERQQALRRDAQIFTTNYEQLPWLVETLGDRWSFRTVVADEATKLKGFRLRQGGQRARSLGQVAHAKVQRFVQLTGTPSPNGLVDLWGQVWFLDRGQRLGRTFSAFTERWFRTGRSGFGLEALPHAQEEIQNLLRDVCLTVEAKDWFDLKAPITNTIHVDLPARARQHYRELEKEMFTQIAEHQVEAFSAAARTIKCLQVANGAAYVGENNAAWKELHDAKLQALESVVEEAGGAPVLVAYHFKSDRERLLKAFGKSCLDVGTAEGLKAAKAGRGRVWIGHPASMGHGVDGLQQHCNQIVFFGHWWNLEERLQIIERIGPTRQMQAGFDRPVWIHGIVARDTVDELILERIQTKREVQDILLDAMKRKGIR